MPADLRRILRTLLRTPTFSVPLLGLLGLGLAAAWVAFDIVFTRLLQPLPYPASARIVALREVAPDGTRRPIALASLLAWRPQVPAFTAAAAYRVQSMTASAAAVPASVSGATSGAALASAAALGDVGAASARASGVDLDIVDVGMVTADFFATLGVLPSPGRGFTAGEELRNEPVAIVSHRLASRARGAAALRLNDRLYAIVGEVPDDLFAIQGRVPEVYVPLDRDRYGRAHDLRTLEAIARLRPEATMEAAAAELARAASLLAATQPQTNRGYGATCVSLHEYLRGARRPAVLLFALGAGLLFVIIAANAMNLLLVRAVARRGEVAVKLSLGATFARLWRECLLEGLVLAVAALALAALLARVLASVVRATMPALAAAGGGEGIAGAHAALGAGGAAAVLAYGLFALTMVIALAGALAMPPMMVARGIRPTRRPTRTRGARVFTAQRLLIAGELAMTFVLLLAAGLLARSFARVLDVDAGFRPDGLLRFGIGLPEARFPTDASQIAFHQRALDALAATPGLDAAAIVLRLPLSGPPPATAMELDAPRLPRGQRPATAINVASPGYFGLMGIPILQGRGFSRADEARAPRVAVVNDAFRRRFTPGASPIGRRVLLDWRSDTHAAGSAWEIVGVVGDTRQAALEQAPVPEVFLSTTQFPIDGASYVLRPSDASTPLAAAVQAVLDRLDPRAQRVQVRTLAGVYDTSLGTRRRTLTLAALFAALALLVAGTGLYGTIAFATAQRRPEFALRLALGAEPRDIIRLVLHTALTLVSLATLPAIAIFYACASLLRHELYDIPWSDWPTWILAVATLLALTLAASLIPARRAARVPLATLLRAEAGL